LVGVNFDAEYTFSEQFFYDGDRAMLTARVQLRNMRVAYTDTGFFGTRVKMQGASAADGTFIPELASTYTGRTLGQEDFKLNRPSLRDGAFSFPVFSKSSDVSIILTNPSPLPCYFVSAEWEALVTTRSR